MYNVKIECWSEISVIQNRNLQGVLDKLSSKIIQILVILIQILNSVPIPRTT
eukprot:UN11396